MNICKLVLACTLTMASSLSTAAETPFSGAANVSTESLYAATTGEVILTFLSKAAAFSTDLSVQGSPNIVFNNQTAEAGTTYSLGNFEAGTQIVFSFFVNETGNTFLSGAAINNADNTAHTAYQQVANSLLVGFEDINFGGDRDYNDIIFSVTNATVGRPVVSPVPEPEIMSMLAAGLMLLGFSNRKKS
ncbi:MAG: PEP-CTERM sorting domain-containing protein [Methylotenera sp.]|nr:MAG: PEP-CTERM sorting domain-containing protein [Methylotenera sp.]